VSLERISAHKPAIDQAAACVGRETTPLGTVDQARLKQVPRSVQTIEIIASTAGVACALAVDGSDSIANVRLGASRASSSPAIAAAGNRAGMSRTKQGALPTLSLPIAAPMDYALRTESPVPCMRASRRRLVPITHRSWAMARLPACQRGRCAGVPTEAPDGPHRSRLRAKG